MTDVYILLKNFDNEGWETYSITTTFKNACEHAKNVFEEVGRANIEFCIEHWYLEGSQYLGTTELVLEKKFKKPLTKSKSDVIISILNEIKR